MVSGAQDDEVPEALALGGIQLSRESLTSGCKRFYERYLKKGSSIFENDGLAFRESAPATRLSEGSFDDGRRDRTVVDHPPILPDSGGAYATFGRIPSAFQAEPMLRGHQNVWGCPTPAPEGKA
jgi:hypothetical protein